MCQIKNYFLKHHGLEMAFKCIKAFYHLENSLILLTPTINDDIRLQVSWKQCFLDGHHDSFHFSVSKSLAQVLCRSGPVLKRSILAVCFCGVTPIHFCKGFVL